MKGRGATPFRVSSLSLAPISCGKVPASSYLYFVVYDRDLFSAEMIGEASILASTNGEQRLV